MTPIKPLLNYKKYKWFYTSTGKLAVGGKSSLQNDELLKKLKQIRKNHVVMHTTSPGSPFTVIIEDIEKVTPRDMEETAIFTGCFSRAWKEEKKKTSVDIFELKQLYKTRGMKAGTWGVRGEIKRKNVELQLVLAIQEGKLRAVPEKTVNKKDILLKIKPGKLDKVDALPKLQVEMSAHVNQEDLLSALPSGGVSIVRE